MCAVVNRQWPIFGAAAGRALAPTGGGMREEVGLETTAADGGNARRVRSFGWTGSLR
eukprot:COSAG01_NODE_2448_length_7682_cov_10.409600_10_plen_57_part_00